MRCKSLIYIKEKEKLNETEWQLTLLTLYVRLRVKINGYNKCFKRKLESMNVLGCREKTRGTRGSTESWSTKQSRILRVHHSTSFPSQSIRLDIRQSSVWSGIKRSAVLVSSVRFTIDKKNGSTWIEIAYISRDNNKPHIIVHTKTQSLSNVQCSHTQSHPQCQNTIWTPMPVPNYDTYIPLCDTIVRGTHVTYWYQYLHACNI